jgi:2-amino-4-hydroxy-6-hydroxymethyldihydropteridine diphosphokinase
MTKSPLPASPEGEELYLSLGSNLGDREDALHRAIALIEERIGTVQRVSSFIETEPWGFESDNKFLNGVILVETTLTPRQLLTVTQKIERELGKRRKHSTRRSQDSSLFRDRPIDIDILLYDDLTIDEPDLKIPHLLMQDRDFVMIPLNEIKQ